MYNLKDIRNVHLELTSKCQAKCPMCPRRINGGIMNPLISLSEITLSQFIVWFPVEFICQLDSLFMCGNLGDPIIAKDCFKIFKYLRHVNPSILLSMHTNGSARTTVWWEQLAQVNVKVTFGIDGLADTHHLNRIDTDFGKIIKNAKAFIDAGGTAEWHMLVFKHNEHQILDCQQLATKIGFKHFHSKYTSRFTESKWHVLEDSGKTTHILYPSERSKEMTHKVKDAIGSIAEIQCKAKKQKQIYVAADGTISPCCWLDFSWVLPKHDNRIDYMDAIGIFPNLNNDSLFEIFANGYFEQIENTWAVKPLTECSKQCGKFDKLGAQFDN